jgi:hypothetical protein
MRPKVYILMAGKIDDYLKMKPIAIFSFKDYNKAIIAWNECKLPYKEIVETIYG